MYDIIRTQYIYILNPDHRLKIDMTIEYMAGKRMVGLSSERSATNVTSGSIFYEKDTNKTYILDSSTWREI